MDIFSYLESKSVDYARSGKNVSRGWIGLHCPYCIDDPSNHLGINLKSLAFSCHICHETGPLAKLVGKIESCSFKRANQIAEEIREDTIGGGYMPVPATKKQLPLTRVLPKYFTDKFPENYKVYLKKRNFDLKYLIEKYQIKAAPNYGPFKFRIIAPIFLNSKVVSYVGRDITDKSNLKYKMCPNEEALVESEDVLYNIDNCGRSLFLVEGITDVWRFGDNTSALLKSTISAGQIKLLLAKKVDQVIVMLDAGFKRQATMIANQLDGLIPDVRVLDLLTGDPDRQSEKNIRRIKKYLQS